MSNGFLRALGAVVLTAAFGVTVFAQATPPPAQPAGAQTQATTTADTDESVARQHLTKARQSLTELTQLPAASKLAGEVRTNTEQLINNFNTLITADSDWKAAYDDVRTNLTALLGSTSVPADVQAETPVGTTGATATLDPTIRAKLEEFRRHLDAFHEAALGTPDAASAAAPASTAGTTTVTTDPAGGTTVTTPSPADTTPAPSTPAVSGTAGTPTTSTTMPAPPPASTQQPGSAHGDMAQHHAQVQQQIDAAIALLDQVLGPSAQAGAANTLSVSRAQLEQLRQQLQALRTAMEMKQ
jgi:hypothetical protein